MFDSLGIVMLPEPEKTSLFRYDNGSSIEYKDLAESNARAFGALSAANAFFSLSRSSVEAVSI